MNDRTESRVSSVSDADIAWRDRARAVLPGGVSTNVRLLDGPQIFIVERARGCRVWDVAGTEYIDYVCGFGSILLGHADPRVNEAVQDALTRGQQFGATHPLEIRLAEQLCATVPRLELVRYSSSGSEAVHAAMRLARAATGRRRIVKFEGHYHGWLDSILVSTHPWPPSQPEGHAVPGVVDSKGVLADTLDHLIVVPWNDQVGLCRVMEEYGGEIAAVIMEPVMCNDGCIAPEPGFLDTVRHLCDEHGSLMILDEVITGFRLGLTGAQGLYGVRPDLSIFGKAIGSGFPISVVGGSRDLMRHFGDGTVNHSGTFNANVASAAAALTTLAALQEGGRALYEDLHNCGRVLMENIAAIGRDLSVPVHVQGPGPVFWMWIFDRALPRALHDHGRIRYLSETAGADRNAYARFRAEMQRRQIRLMPGGRWYVSCAHDDRVIEQTLRAVRECLTTIR